MDGAKATINYAFTEIDCDSIDHSYSLHGRQGIIRILLNFFCRLLQRKMSFFYSLEVVIQLELKAILIASNYPLIVGNHG